MRKPKALANCAGGAVGAISLATRNSPSRPRGIRKPAQHNSQHSAVTAEPPAILNIELDGQSMVGTLVYCIATSGRQLRLGLRLANVSQIFEKWGYSK